MQNNLFQPLRIGPRELRNRIIFGSHTTNYAQHNLLSNRHAGYYAARAEGGAGAIVLEEHIVHPSDLPYANALLGYLPETPAAIARVTERIHAHNSLVLVQLNHNGRQSTSNHSQQELWTPSAVPDVASREMPKVMEPADIQAVIECFALVALEARAAALGPDCVLGVRFCADELAPWAGITPEQSIEIARLLAATGRIDYMTITMGSIFSTHMFPFHASIHTPPDYAAHLATSVKAAISIPVFAAGRITNVAQAERILAEEQADGVEMIRALIADPQLPRLSQEGRADEVRPCISCNQGCQVRTVMNVALGCTVNPDVIHMRPTALLPGGQQRIQQAPALLIIGGGPAGMEAARTAILRGRKVVLYEREETLGGAVALAARGPGRGELQLITDYLQAQLEKLDVEVHLGVEVTAEMVLAQRPDSVVVATGAHTGYGLLPIPGHDLPHVTDIRRILRGEQVEGERVVIIDEMASHGVLSVAELLATQGHSVEVVTGDWYVGRDLVATHDIVHRMQRVMALGLLMTPHTTVRRIEAGQVIVTDRFIAGERALAADVVVLGTYERPSQELYYALKGRVPHLFRAGDCVAPRRIEQAILEGRQVGEQF